MELSHKLDEAVPYPRMQSWERCRRTAETMAVIVAQAKGALTANLDSPPCQGEESAPAQLQRQMLQQPPYKALSRRGSSRNPQAQRRARQANHQDGFCLDAVGCAAVSALRCAVIGNKNLHLEAR